MKPETKAPENLTDDALFDLLERPEDWPDDPKIQAHLAELLELHLALCEEGKRLDVPQKRLRGLKPLGWGLAACAAAVLPLVFVIHKLQETRSVEQIHATAQARNQERLWADFFTQSSHLLKRFERSTDRCSNNHEDRRSEREMAVALLATSHQLDGSKSPSPQAEALRKNLKSFLLDLSVEDGCMAPERADEMRHYAKAFNLEAETQRQDLNSQHERVL